MESLDPRISRLDKATDRDPKELMDQLETYEVFVQMRENKPYRHEGVVHANSEEMAFLFAKEQFSRRQSCFGIWIVKTINVFVSPYTDADTNVYSAFNHPVKGDVEYEVFHMLKRGKQHIYAGQVQSDSIENAFHAASEAHGDTMAFNLWISEKSNVLKSSKEDVDMWNTLPDKKFRDAIAYRAGDKLKDFLEKSKQ